VNHSVAVAVGRWFVPPRHGGHTMRDLVLLVGLIVMVGTFVQTIR
jgi:hypothetical protein